MTETSQNSIIINGLDEAINLNKNCFFSPLLTLGLKELNNKGVEHYESNILETISNYNFDEDIIPSDGYSKTFETTKDGFNLSLKLSKELPFKKPYWANENPLKIFDKNTISFTPEIRDIDLIFFNNENDFAFELKPKEESQQIIFVKKQFAKNTTFLNQYQSLRSSNDVILPGDIVSIPFIKVEVDSKYNEIKNRQTTYNSKQLSIEEITENLIFKLDNKGAVILNEIKIAGRYNCFNDNPKQLIIDNTFIVFLKQKKSPLPYFAGYFNNSEFLQCYDKLMVKEMNQNINI